MTEVDVQELVLLLARASAAATRAVRTLPLTRRGEVVGMGADGEPTTAVDRAAEAAVLALLAESPCPLVVLSEEAGEVVVRPGPDPVYVLLDPVDATVNAVRGLAQHACSLAAFWRGRPVAAALRDLGTGELYTAAAGKGAWLDGRRLGVRDCSLKDAVVAFGPVRAESARRALERLVDRGAGVRLYACPSLSLAEVARGRVSGFLGLGRTGKVHRLFDVAAAAQVVEAAGGVVTDADGRPLPWRLDDLTASVTVVAGGPRLHRELLALVADLGA